MFIVSHPFSVTFSTKSELKYINFKNYFTPGTEAIAWGHEFNPQNPSEKAALGGTCHRAKSKPTRAT